MPTTTQAVAPASIYEFLESIGAARGVEPLTERQRYALRHPPEGFKLDPAEAERDGYFSGRGRVDNKLFAAFILRNHETRVAHIESAIGALRDKIALPLERIQRIPRDSRASRNS